MYTFTTGIVLLVLGYLFYSRFVAGVIGISPDRKSPALRMADGVDYVPMPTWKVFMIQFLNIAGLGPIFGAISGAAFGPVAYLWIVFGNIFMGAVHDMCVGVLSMRNDGANLPTLVGRHLGSRMKIVMALLTIGLLLAIAGSFIGGPADLLSIQTGWSKMLWVCIIFGYYVLAAIVSIDKIIGKIYPLFGAFLLFMALAVGIMMFHYAFCGDVTIPELTSETFHNYHWNPKANPIFPMMFIIISCGALSGFHATQSPLMARCLKNEKYARQIFYGSMICEGIVAMIWATAAMTYLGGPEALNEAMASGVTPAMLVDRICRSWIGKLGGLLAIVGVILCPITSGDTALRSMRLTVAELLKVDQRKVFKRILVSIPVFAAAFALCMLDFNIIWKMMGIFNQTLSMVILWAMAEALKQRSKHTWILSIPATFISFICILYYLSSPHEAGGMAINYSWSCAIAAFLTLCLDYLFYTDKISEIRNLENRK